ncbi:MAG: TonB-dependent receptor [bacterium]|nr:TonB-dependent receptor [bacterium]
MLILIFPARSFAQEGPGPSVRLTPVEVTSTRIPTPADEATDSITIINLGESKGDSAPLVADQIREVPGVGVQASGSVGEETIIRIRGSEQYQTLVLFDGVRLNSSFTRAADLSDYFAAGLDRIEIVRGAFGSLYGSDAIGGVINLIPYPGRSLLQGIKKEKGASVWAEGGSYSTFKERAEIFSAGEESAVSLGLARVDSGGRNARDGFAGNLATGKYQILVPGGIEVGISALFSNSKKELYLDTPISLYLQQGALTQVRDSNYSEERETLLTAVSLRKQLFLNGELSISGSVLRGEDDLLNPPDPGWTDSYSSWTDTWRKGIGFQLNLSPIKANSILFGGEYSEEDAREILETNLMQGGEGDPQWLKIDGGRIERALFFEDRLKIRDVFFLNAGLRGDFSSDLPDSKIFLSPRGSAAFVLSPWGTKIRGGAGRGYRSPAVEERFFPIQGNPELKPEEAWSYDAGLEQEIVKYGIKFDLTWFWLRYKNLIGLVPDSLQLQNSDLAKADGLEAGLAYQPDKRLRIKLGYTFNRARKRTAEPDEESGQPVEKWSNFFWRPRHSFAGTLSIVPVKELSAGVSWEWRGGYDEPENIVDPDGKPLNGNNPGFARVNLFSEYTIPYSLKPLESLSVFFRGENILNRKYSEVKGFPMPGISFYGGVNLKI